MVSISKSFWQFIFNYCLILSSYQISVLAFTYLAYMCYHMSRKPISVVKTVLNQNCSNLTPPANVPPDHISNWCDWAPFGILIEKLHNIHKTKIKCGFRSFRCIPVTRHLRFGILICICHCNVRIWNNCGESEPQILPGIRNDVFWIVQLPVWTSQNLQYT